MNNFEYKSKVMWSMVDANMHLRHSAYADFAAQARLELLEKSGIGLGVFAKHQIGPILFREELIYHKEVRLNDEITVTCELTKLSEDGVKWSFTQKISRGDGLHAATIHVDGAWFDLQKRKLTTLPPEMLAVFNKLSS